MRKSFVTGLIILLPIALTFLIISFILDIFTAPFLEIATKLLKKLEQPFTFLSSPEVLRFMSKILIIILFFTSVTLLGFLANLFFFKTLLSFANKILLKIPFFKSIYHTAKDMITSIFSLKERKAFKYPVVVNFPSEKSKCLGFASGTIPKEIQEKTKLELESVFVPTAPHPISGYLILTPKKEIQKVNITNEDAIKFTISCGLIIPGKTTKK